MRGCAVVSISKPCCSFIITTPSFPRRSKTKRLSPFFDPPRVSSVSFSPKPFVSVLQLNKEKTKNNGKFGGFRRRGCSAISSKCTVAEASDGDFVVVNFYRFVFLEDPGKEVAKHLSFLQGLDIHGRVYLNEQGINAQLMQSNGNLRRLMERVPCGLLTQEVTNKLGGAARQPFNMEDLSLFKRVVCGLPNNVDAPFKLKVPYPKTFRGSCPVKDPKKFLWTWSSNSRLLMS